MLKVYSPEADNFDDGDVETLELLSGLVAAHMSHASLFAAEVHGGRHDALTGLLNRRAYEERLPVEIARANRFGWPLSLCLLDLDGFKKINDTLGHPAGDRALQQVAALIDESRLTDDGFRIGGDEFAILMPQTEREDAELAARGCAGRSRRSACRTAPSGPPSASPKAPTTRPSCTRWPTNGC